MKRELLFVAACTAKGMAKLKPSLWLRWAGSSPLGLRLAACLLLVSTLCSVGCRNQFIPNTDVKDTEENRRVLEFCEEYRRSVERRNIGQLLELAHPSYYEDGGNIDATDDIDYAGLREFLESKFVETKAIRYEIRYHRVKLSPEKTIFVEFTYSASYKIPTNQGDIWRRQVADDRLELIPEGDSFKILSGM
ncbi:MAG: hypothetical protein MK135_15625 [Polyangiaceae bacterium]|nr:hypothetical protein [Polyangiaceae bacterium]